MASEIAPASSGNLAARDPRGGHSHNKVMSPPLARGATGRKEVQDENPDNAGSRRCPHHNGAPSGPASNLERIHPAVHYRWVYAFLSRRINGARTERRG